MSDPLVFTVSKADPTGKEPTVGAVLNITADLQQVKGEHPHRVWRALTINQHVQDAQQVCAALAHLPQGTVDQVLVLLLQQRASLLRLPASIFPDRARSEAEDARELDWLRGYLERDPSCPASEVRAEIVRRIVGTAVPEERRPNDESLLDELDDRGLAFVRGYEGDL